MRTTQQISVTLPKEMAAQIKAKVASGEYVSESEVVREGLRALQARDRAIDEWLRRDVVQIYDAMREDPTRGRSIDQVRIALAKVDDRFDRPG
jgi:antitoxin ParD1/3/4